jgi:hypothetical protein
MVKIQRVKNDGSHLSHMLGLVFMLSLILKDTLVIEMRFSTHKAVSAGGKLGHAKVSDEKGGERLGINV